MLNVSDCLCFSRPVQSAMESPTVVLATQPLLSTPVSEYTVVADAVSVLTLPVSASVIVVHEYSSAPEADSTAVSPAQTVGGETEVVKVGSGSTINDTTLVPRQ